MAGFQQKPRFFLCQICGKEFGSASLPIHMRSCILKYEQGQAVLPLRMRKPLPPLKTPAEMIAARAASDSRAIRPLMSGGGDLASLSAQHRDLLNEASFESFQQQLCPCEHCGRRFLPDRLLVHLKSCSSGRAHKPSASAQSSSARGLHVAPCAAVPLPSSVPFSSSAFSTASELFHESFESRCVAGRHA